MTCITMAGSSRLLRRRKPDACFAWARCLSMERFTKPASRALAATAD
jgi:hypothetical protein